MRKTGCGVLMPLIYVSGVQSFLGNGYVVMPLGPPDGVCESSVYMGNGWRLVGDSWSIENIEQGNGFE